MKKLVILCLLLMLVGSVAAQTEPWCGVTYLYFQNAPSPDITGYEQLINYPSGAPETDENITLTAAGGIRVIDTYISPPGLPGSVTISKGLRRYRTYAYVDKDVGITRINFTPLVRYSNGTERVLYSVLTNDINGLIPVEQLTSYVSPTDLDLGTDTRLAIRVSANTTSSAAVILHWVYEGTTHYSSVESGNFVCEDTSDVSSSNIVEVQDVPSSPFLAVSALAVIGLLAYRKLYR